MDGPLHPTRSGHSVLNRPLWVPETQPVGAGNSVTLCDLRVLVEQAAEPITSDELDIGIDFVPPVRQRLWWCGRSAVTVGGSRGDPQSGRDGRDGMFWHPLAWDI